MIDDSIKINPIHKKYNAFKTHHIFLVNLCRHYTIIIIVSLGSIFSYVICSTPSTCFKTAILHMLQLQSGKNTESVLSDKSVISRFSVLQCCSAAVVMGKVTRCRDVKRILWGLQFDCFLHQWHLTLSSSQGLQLYAVRMNAIIAVMLQ